LHDKDNGTESKQQEQQVHEKEVQQQLQEQNNNVDGSHSQQQQQQQQSDEIDVKRYDDPDKAESDIESQSSNKNLIPFSVDGKDDKYALTQKENIIPLWGEEITINKKMVKIGEIVIRKYHTTNKQKIDVDVKSEKIIIKYPDGRQEDIV